MDRKIYSGRVLNNPPKNFFYFLSELSKRKYIRGGGWIEKYIWGGFLTIHRKTSFILFVNCQKENIFGGWIEKYIWGGFLTILQKTSFIFFPNCQKENIFGEGS